MSKRIASAATVAGSDKWRLSRSVAERNEGTCRAEEGAGLFKLPSLIHRLHGI